MGMPASWILGAVAGVAATLAATAVYFQRRGAGAALRSAGGVELSSAANTRYAQVGRDADDG